MFACFMSFPFHEYKLSIPRVGNLGGDACISLLITSQFSFMAGTTANAVTVGLTQTESVMMCPPDVLESFKKEFITLQSIPKFGQPEDVADVVGLLCSRDARWITGSVISASGGGIKIG
jgi:hypothetical protein